MEIDQTHLSKIVSLASHVEQVRLSSAHSQTIAQYDPGALRQPAIDHSRYHSHFRRFVLQEALRREAVARQEVANFCAANAKKGAKTGTSIAWAQRC